MRARRDGPRLVAMLALGVGVTLGACAPAPAAPSSAAPAAPASPSNAAPAAPGATAGSAPAAPAAAPPDPDRVKVSISVGAIGTSPIAIASERGYWREEGIELEDMALAMGSTAQSLPALATNQLELITGGTTSGLFNAIAQGISLRIVLDQMGAPPGSESNGVLLRKALDDSGRVRQPADLRGLRVGFTAKGHSTEMVASTLLDQDGLSLQDVEPVEILYPEMNVALANGNLDAAVSIEPFVSIAANGGYAVRWRSWADVLPNDQISSIMFSATFADERNAVAKRFAKAYVRGARDYEAARTRGVNREEVIAILMKHLALKDRALYDFMPWAPMNPNGRVNGKAIAAAQDWFATHGYVPRPVDLTKVIDHQFADYAVAQLGPERP